MYNLRGKTALVTGSLSGIGLAVAKSLARVGANIVLNGFAPQSHIDQITNEIQTNNVKAKFIYADLKIGKDAKSLVEKSISQFGGVDILVNNAGMQHIDTTQNFPENIWQDIINLNLSSSFYTTKAVLPYMKSRQWGRIINIASVHGLVASVNKPAYVAAKHGLIGFTKAVALQNATFGITCNSICPGFVLTPLIQTQIDIRAKQFNVSTQQAKSKLLEGKQPSGKFCNPEDIGQLSVFLTSKYADQVNGASYAIDGGWTAQ